MQTTEVVKLLDGVTADTTGNNAYVGDAERVCFLLTCADHSSGNGVFTFNGGVGSDIHTTAPTTVALNVITTNVANTNGETILRTTGVTLNSNTSVLLWLDLKEFPVQFINCAVDVTTDGTYTCWMCKLIKD